MAFDLPPIVKLAQRLQAELEEAVRRFPRYHKYAHGATLRAQAMEVTQTAWRAWQRRGERVELLEQLVLKMDDLKLSIQLGKDIRAFRSFGEFTRIWQTAIELGRQCGGWYRQHSKGQNAAPSMVPQRARKLSSRAASIEANP